MSRELHPTGDVTYPVADAFLAPSRFGGDAANLMFASPYGELFWEGGLEGEWLAKTVKSLRAAGFVGDDLATLRQQLVGKPVPLWIKHKTGKKGGVYVQVLISNGANAPPAPYKQDQAESIARALKGAIAEAEKNGEAPPPVRRDLAPPILDDDVPFSFLIAGLTLALTGLAGAFV